MEQLSKEAYKSLLEETRGRFVSIPADRGLLVIDRKTGVEYYAKLGDNSTLNPLFDRDGKLLINEKI